MVSCCVIHICVHICMGDTILTSEFCMGYSTPIVWDTASTDSYGGTVFPGGIRYSLMYVGYNIHWDTGFTLTPVHRPLPDFILLLFSTAAR